MLVVVGRGALDVVLVRGLGWGCLDVEFWGWSFGRCFLQTTEYLNCERMRVLPEASPKNGNFGSEDEW